ncbi:MAG: MerC domain-containing protein [Sphingobium sp.]
MYHCFMMTKEGIPPRGQLNASARKVDWLDGFAVCASVTCMIHCLGLPLLLAALPTFADQSDPGESFHAIVLALTVPTSAFALISGWRKHRAFVPLVVGAIGLAMIAIGIAFASRKAVETAVTVSGSLLLAGAHVANWRRRRHRPAPFAAEVDELSS